MKRMMPAALDRLHRFTEAPQRDDEIRQVVRQGWRLGSSRQETIERVAQRMYERDLRDFGAVLGLGLYSWEMYLEEATWAVDSLLPQEPGLSSAA